MIYPNTPKRQLYDNFYVESNGCEKSVFCDPTRRLYRYFVLIFLCFLVFGSSFCYDNPVALEDKMMIDLKLSAANYMNFYAWYSWPNVILGFVNGFLLDRVFGFRIGTVIFSVFVVSGQILFSEGVYSNNYYLAVFGRFVFGVGSESLYIAQSIFTSAWFLDSELSFIYGLQMCITRLASTINMNIMDPIYNAMPLQGYQRLGLTLLIASSTCFVSFFCSICLAWFDLKASRILKGHTKKDSTPEKFGLCNFHYFPWSFWIICGICVTYYSSLSPFLSLSKIFFINKYNLDGKTASFIISLIYIISAICCPIVGLIIDLTGHNLYWLLAGTLATLVSHAFYAFTYANPVHVMILLSVSYSILASSLWPLVVFVIPIQHRGTAFGIMLSIQNFGLAVVGIVSGVILDKYQFFVLQIFFSTFLIITLFFIVILYFWDIRNKSHLNDSCSRRKK